MATTAILCDQSGVARLMASAFESEVTITGQADVAGGRGTFSDVLQLKLAGPSGTPSSVVAKLPAANANREAAARSGAYRREAIAYDSLLPHSPVSTPTLFASVVVDDTAAFLLEDLTSLRRVDQIDGLDADDTAAVVEALGRFHRHWRTRLATPGNNVERLGVRRAAVAGFRFDALNRGLDVVRERWPEVSSPQVAAFAGLLKNASHLVDAFATEAERAPTLCHGDPRADNLCFDDDGPRIFDWQQIAVQFAEADLAWLVATSLTPETRRQNLDDLLNRFDVHPDRFRLGLVLPGLAALLLAQREAAHTRTRRFISTSLQRIGAALIDHDVATIPA